MEFDNVVSSQSEHEVPSRAKQRVERCARASVLRGGGARRALFSGARCGQKLSNRPSSNNCTSPPGGRETPTPTLLRYAVWGVGRDILARAPSSDTETPGDQMRSHGIASNKG